MSRVAAADRAGVELKHLPSCLCVYARYQGTNAALYSFIAAMCYVRAQLRGEFMPDAKDNKGRGGGKA